MCPWFTFRPFLHLIHYPPVECYHAARFEKELRYFVIRLSRDLLGDWVITLINGRIKSKLGQSRNLAFSQFNDAFDHFCSLSKINHKRGYELKTLACDNHLMLHMLPFMIFTKTINDLPIAKTVKNINQRERVPKKTDSLNYVPQALFQQLGFTF